MDVGFYILVPEIPKFSGFDYKVDTFVWGGVDYPQEPGRYVWGQHVEFMEANVTEFLMQILPAGSISHDWRALCLKDPALDLLQREVNGIDVDWGGRSLIVVIRQILMRSIKWVVVFALHNDQIDHLYQLNVDQCIERLRQNLLWNINPDGFIVIPPR